MLTGKVLAQEAVVRILVHGPDGRRGSVAATIDTGFDGCLALPPFMVSDLELRRTGSALATLADGTTASLDLFRAAVEWHGEGRPVLVLQADSGVLLGMALLERSRLIVDVVEGGQVLIQEL